MSQWGQTLKYLYITLKYTYVKAKLVCRIKHCHTWIINTGDPFPSLVCFIKYKTLLPTPMFIITYRTYSYGHNKLSSCFFLTLYALDIFLLVFFLAYPIEHSHCTYRINKITVFICSWKQPNVYLGTIKHSYVSGDYTKIDMLQ